MRWAPFWMLLPDEALPFIVVGLGFAVLFGFLRLRGAMAILVGLVVLPVLLAPSIDGMMEEVPRSVSLATLVVLGLILLRGLAALLLGGRAADHMTGILAADVVRLVVLGLLVMPLRVVRWALRQVTNGNWVR